MLPILLTGAGVGDAVGDGEGDCVGADATVTLPDAVKLPPLVEM